MPPKVSLYVEHEDNSGLYVQISGLHCSFLIQSFFLLNKKEKNISYFFHPYRTTLLSFCTATDGTGGGFRSNFFLLLEEDTSQSQGPTLQDLILLLINLRFLEWQSGRTSPTYTHLRPNLLHPIKSLCTA